MELLIDKIILSPTIQNEVTRLKLKSDDIWHIYFDSGIEYLDILAHRTKRKRYLDRQFKQVFENTYFRSLTFNEVFITIRNSPSFWFWWSTELWRLCKNEDFQDKTELLYMLEFNFHFIPHFILKRIFNVKNTQCRQGTGSIHSTKASQSGATQGSSREKFEFFIRNASIPGTSTSKKQH